MNSSGYFQSWLVRQESLQKLLKEDPRVEKRALGYAKTWLSLQHSAAEKRPDILQERNALEALNSGSFENSRILDIWNSHYKEQSREWTWLADRIQKGAEDSEAARELLAREWARSFSNRQEQSVMRNLAGELPDFRRNFIEKIKKLSTAEKTIESIFGERDLGWDFTEGDWQELDLAPLSKWAENLAKEREILRIAELIGRDYRAKSRPSEPPPVVPPRKNDVPEAGKVEIRGITQGGSLSDSLTTELTLLTFPETQTVFLKKYAEGELLTSDFKAPMPPPKRRQHSQTQAQAVNERGPAIICLDTSGSMRGKPEEVAKLAVLALVKICLLEKRRCFLINFSTQLKTLELTDLKTELPELLSFLSFSFHGGTDLPPALRKGLGLMKEKKWKEADMLVVSDFAVPKIPGDLRQQIRYQQENFASCFYALTISSRPMNDFLNIFDGTWVYSLHQNRMSGIDPDTLHSL